MINSLYKVHKCGYIRWINLEKWNFIDSLSNQKKTIRSLVNTDRLVLRILLWSITKVQKSVCIISVHGCSLGKLTHITSLGIKKQNSITTPRDPFPLTPPPWQREQSPDFDIHEFFLPVFELCTNRIKENEPFCIGFLWLSICLPDPSVTACSQSAFVLSAVYYFMVRIFHNLSTHSGWTFRLFSVRAYYKECFVNIPAFAFCWTGAGISLGCIS